MAYIDSLQLDPSSFRAEGVDIELDIDYDGVREASDAISTFARVGVPEWNTMELFGNGAEASMAYYRANEDAYDALSLLTNSATGFAQYVIALAESLEQQRSLLAGQGDRARAAGLDVVNGVVLPPPTDNLPDFDGTSVGMWTDDMYFRDFQLRTYAEIARYCDALQGFVDGWISESFIPAAHGIPKAGRLPAFPEFELDDMTKDLGIETLQSWLEDQASRQAQRLGEFEDLLRPARLDPLKYLTNEDEAKKLWEKLEKHASKLGYGVDVAELGLSFLQGDAPSSLLKDIAITLASAAGGVVGSGLGPFGSLLAGWAAGAAAETMIDSTPEHWKQRVVRWADAPHEQDVRLRKSLPDETRNRLKREQESGQCLVE